MEVSCSAFRELCARVVNEPRHICAPASICLVYASSHIFFWMMAGHVVCSCAAVVCLSCAQWAGIIVHSLECNKYCTYASIYAWQVLCYQAIIDWGSHFQVWWRNKDHLDQATSFYHCTPWNWNEQCIRWDKERRRQTLVLKLSATNLLISFFLCPVWCTYRCFQFQVMYQPAQISTLSPYSIWCSNVLLICIFKDAYET